jgi:hypothetical protein
MKVVIMGDVERGIDHGSVAAGGRRGRIDRAFANRAGNPGRAGADILAYREDRSFAVARALGLHHQTVQRCVERAVAEGRDGGARRSPLAPAGN